MSRAAKLFAGPPVVRGIEVYEFPKEGRGRGLPNHKQFHLHSRRRCDGAVCPGRSGRNSSTFLCRNAMNRPCPDRSCPGVVRDGTCSHCGRARRRRLPNHRAPSHKRGYDKRWERIRAAVLASEPLCRHCTQQGRLTSAVLVDHIVPLPRGSHSIDNLQPLCASCHAVKTVSERSA